MDACRPLARGTLLLVILGAILLCPPGWAHSPEDEPDEERQVEGPGTGRRGRGQLVPGQTRYAGTIQGQGQTSPAAVTTTIRDAGQEWIVEDAWTLGVSSVIETSTLEKDTLFLLRHTSSFFAGTIRELEVRDGRIEGSLGMPGSPRPRQRISIDAPDPILAWGAGVPQVIAALPLASGYSTTISDIKFPDAVLSPKLEVVGIATLRIPAGTFEAWKVVVHVAEPGRHALTVWVDVRSRQVLRYDGSTQGPGPSWTVTLER